MSEIFNPGEFVYNREENIQKFTEDLKKGFTNSEHNPSLAGAEKVYVESILSQLKMKLTKETDLNSFTPSTLEHSLASLINMTNQTQPIDKIVDQLLNNIKQYES